MRLLEILLQAVAIASMASAHGGAWKYSVDGVDYAPYKWWEAAEGQVSIQRRWPSRYPLYTSEDKNIACNDDGSPTTPSIYAPISAGGIFNAHYDKNFTLPGESVGINETWSHEWGPMAAYLAACGSDGCENMDITAPVWFKILEIGLLSGTWTTGHWGMMDLNTGAPFSIPIPKELKPGKYLLRHEIIAIHTEPRQIYAECAQIEVTGSGNALPLPEQLVAFPGAYSDSDPGINLTTYGFWIEHANDTFYPIPGPKVWEP